MDIEHNYLIDEKLGFSRLELANRIFWLIRLRWFFIIGVFLAALIAYLTGAEIRYRELLICNALLIALNSLYKLIARSIDFYPVQDCYHRYFVLTNVQISLDFLVLTFLLHFSGGIENPFRQFYVLHTITAGILLTAKVGFSQTTFGIVCYISMAITEFIGVIPHYAFNPNSYFAAFSWPHMASNMVVFALTQYIAFYMTMSIMKRQHQHAAELLRAYHELAHIDNVKMEFIRSTSHELKTPIAAIQSMAQTVLEIFSTSLPDEALKMLHRIQLRSQETLKQISKMLEVGKYHLENLDVYKIAETDWRAILTEQIESQSELAVQKKLKFKIMARENTSPLLTDPNVLRLITANLISNAIRYSKEGGQIEVYLRERPGRLVLGIKDKGIGIPRAELKKVFGDYYRTESARKHHNLGTGLGLYLVKKYTEGLGGTIRLRSEEEKGTTVTVSIPILR